MTEAMVHVHMGGGQHAPCGAKVSTSNFGETVASSSEDLERVTCTGCKALVVRFVTRYTKAKREKRIGDWARETKGYIR